MAGPTPPYNNDQHNPASAIPVYVTGPPPGSVPAAGSSTYQTLAAGATNVVLGTTGAAGDTLTGLLVTPLTTAPGSVIIGDGVSPNITLFTGGVGSINNLVPLPLPLGIRSKVGGWHVTLGANMTAVAVGTFT